MTLPYESKQRREWLQWHFDNGENVASTCRQFGISRATFYRWLTRYDPDKPSKPLLSRSHKVRNTKKSTWGEVELEIVAEFNNQSPTAGASKMTARLRQLDFDYSQATIGRMLAQVRYCCPICKMQGTHNRFQHFFHYRKRRRTDRIRDAKEWKEDIDRNYRAGHKQPGT